MAVLAPPLTPAPRRDERPITSPEVSVILRSPGLLWLLPLVLVVMGAIAWRGTIPRAALLVRTLLFASLVVALADPMLPGTAAPPALLVLVDASASVPAERRDESWQAALAAADAHGRDQTTLAAFGRNVVVAAGDSLPEVDGAASDIPAALRLARGLLPDDTGRILLISDGASTSPGAETAAAELAAAGITVDVLQPTEDERGDARVAEIGVPAGLREGQSFRGEIVIAASAATTATLRLEQEGEEPSSQRVTLEAGRNVVSFAGTAGRSGVHRYVAQLELDDAHAENNRLERAVVVGPVPRVLVVERTPDSAAQLRDLLEQGGVQSEARRPDDLPHRLSELERFDAVVLQDVPAASLSLDQQAALREYVRALGRGLLALGGANSYGLGEYAGTPLEDVLPVDMHPPPRRERQNVTLLLILDRSASMYGSDPRTSKLELAKGGAIAATQALVPNDRLGMVIFDTNTEWVIPFTTVGEGRSLSQIQDEIARIEFGGGTDIYAALEEGLPAISAEAGGGPKHVVLLTDGRSYANDRGYERLIEQARAAGVTLSTIAIGDDADTELLERLANQGAGRYHFAADPQELPQLTLKETEIAREDPKVEAEIQPRPQMVGASAHPTLRGFVPRRLPRLGGYVATTVKPTADLILASPEGDAILAGWQYGLGRALAWTSDSGERWAGNWQSWNEGASFWTQVLAYTFPDPAIGPLQARVEPGRAGAEVVAEAFDAAGAPIDLADVAVRLQEPAGTEQTLRLKQVAPGRYAARLDAPLAPGAYRLSAALRKGEQRLEALAAWSQAYPAEFAGTLGGGELLQRVAEVTGGRTMQTAEEATTALVTPPARDPRPLWPWLAGLALALWPVEIAIRRGWLLRLRAADPRGRRGQPIWWRRRLEIHGCDVPRHTLVRLGWTLPDRRRDLRRLLAQVKSRQGP
ncbi:MAG TPA: VWA domain-containing protein [Herpetosiphonaceae bacterium]|nr:VWA domain-containing protein [Herpetosiphonaceae bacterium]